MTYLLQNLPTLVLGIMLLVASVILALVALSIVRPYVRRSLREYHNDVAGFMFAVVGVVYGVLAAFVVFAVWQQYTTADSAASTEGATLIAMYQEAQPFPAPIRNEIQGALRNYTQAVVGQEWHQLSHGHESQPARTLYDRIYSVYGRVSPRNARERALYAQSLVLLDQLSIQRRLRIHASHTELPGVFWFVLIAGAIFTIGFSMLFYMEHAVVQGIMTAALTALIAAMLFLVFVINHPFAGTFQVAPQEFRQALATFNQISSR